jgi:phosphotriesterase-related protein
MALSQDAACHMDWIAEPVRKMALPRRHYTHLHDDVIPWVLKWGVTREQIDTLLVDVPRRHFE